MKCPYFLSTFLVFFKYLNILLCAAQNSTSLTLYQVGVVLDMESPIGMIGNRCISMAVSDFYDRHTHFRTRLVLHTRDSMEEPLHALSSAIDLLENDKVQAIIGPETSDEAEFLVGLGDKAKVPIISFSATSPFLSPFKNPYFIRVATNDNSQVGAIAAIVQAFRWREIILIHEDTFYGNGIIPNLVFSLEEINARVPYRSVVSPIVRDDDIVLELYKLMSMSTRVFIVHMSSLLASRFFLMAKEMGMMSEGYAWIITDGITNNLYSMDSSVIDSMQGVIGIRPYITHSEELNNFTLKCRSKFPEMNQNVGINELSVYCLWAYDAVWALARAAEKVDLFASKLRKNSTSKLTYLGSLFLSQTGPELLKAISESKFKGLSGEFQLVNGQVEPLAFQIVNIVGKGAKEIGFWTVKNGISQKFNLSNNSIHSAPSPSDLEAISWPGGSLSVPNGWVKSVSGKRLRVGVPVKEGFTELIKVDHDQQSNATMVSGFCVDVFKAAIDMLPYDVPYDFVPFKRSSRRHPGTYDELVYQVYLQNFDAAVGDITITANRSLYVDFTLPFTEFGLGMIVPIGTAKPRSMWIFLEPLTVDLWLTSGAFFILTGCVVWVIERGDNIEFKAPGMIFWYSFSTLVFSHREKLMSNLSRFVVIVWLFVVLILTSSYNASLSSMLTVQQLRLLPKGSSIVYPYDSDIYHKGVPNTMFGNATVRPLRTVDEYDIALRKGSKHGGVSAIIDEIPYIKLFLAKYSAHYTMLAPSYKSTNGFGFVFPKGSPLVPDISQAIAKLREDGKLDLIEQNWIQNHSVFRTQESPTDPTVLNFYNLRGLFFIAGISSTLALIIFCFSKKNIESANEKQSGVGVDINPTVDQEEERWQEYSDILPTLVISDHSSGSNSIEEQHTRLSRENSTEDANQLPT